MFVRYSYPGILFLLLTMTCIFDSSDGPGKLTVKEVKKRLPGTW